MLEYNNNEKRGQKKKIIVNFERLTNEGFDSARCELPGYHYITGVFAGFSIRAWNPAGLTQTFAGFSIRAQNSASSTQMFAGFFILTGNTARQGDQRCRIFFVFLKYGTPETIPCRIFFVVRLFGKAALTALPDSLHMSGIRHNDV